MRLRAVQNLIYLGEQIPAGWRFDAFENDALDLINRDLAHPFGLEDPSTRPLSVILEQMLPAVTVTIDPSEASFGFQGGSGSFNVTLSGPGVWTVSLDPGGTSWISITAPPEMQPQTVSGTVAYTVASNSVPPQSDRASFVSVNDQTFSITQTKPGPPSKTAERPKSR